MLNWGTLELLNKDKISEYFRRNSGILLLFFNSSYYLNKSTAFHWTWTFPFWVFKRWFPAHFEYKIVSGNLDKTKKFWEISTKIKFLSCITQHLLSKDKTSKLYNLKMLFLLKILSYENLNMTSQFDLTQLVTL